VADVKAIRDRLKTLLQTVSGLFVYDTMPRVPVTPCAIVVPAPGLFIDRATLDGAEDLEFVIVVALQQVVDGAAQDNTDTYLSEGSSSIVAALNSGSTTDWDYTVALNARNYGEVVFGEGEGALRFLGFEVPVQVAVS
jgi:hypothetical protein